MGCGRKLVGLLLIVFNISLFVFGLALIGIGLWSAIDKVYVAHVIGDDMFSAASYLVSAGGVILLVISVFGLCYLRRERRLFVVIYFFLLLIIFVALILAAILAVAFKAELEDEMTNAMRSTLVSGYGSDSSVTHSWDRLQKDLECCGVRASTSELSGSNDKEYTRQDSWLLYQRTRWYQNARQLDVLPVEFVPPSCCVHDEHINDYKDLKKCQTWELGPPGNLQFNINNNALHYDGCYEKAKDFIGEQADILIGCTFAFALGLIAGLVLTVMLYRILREQTEVMKRRR